MDSQPQFVIPLADVTQSLWSDAAMLHRREVGLDPARSRMAVLVQAMRTEAVSGVAFAPS